MMGQSPNWGWYIVWYFFIGGIAGGAYFTAVLADLFGGERDREVAKVGYSIAFPLVLLCPILLTLDLGVPARAFKMFRAFDIRSPMSVGSWALLGFGLFAAFSAITAFLEDRGWRGLAFPRRVVGVVGALFGLFIASYTGVLLQATNRPFWAGSPLVGALFLASGASTGLAAIALLLYFKRAELQQTWAKLERADGMALALEALVLIAFLLGLGPLSASLLQGPFALPFWGGLVVLGLLAPFALHLVSWMRGRRAYGIYAIGSVFVLVGGFTLRYVIIMAGQAL